MNYIPRMGRMSININNHGKEPFYNYRYIELYNKKNLLHDLNIAEMTKQISFKEYIHFIFVQIN